MCANKILLFEQYHGYAGGKLAERSVEISRK
jgi:hypothetical protein